ncbi:MAG TPA: DsbA family protein [Candidatus Paceibacterota bacterium]|nr:DsbA family protein [Candidatus Paceibacterota bacterium]
MDNKKDLGLPIAIIISGILISASIYATGGIKIISGTAGEANLPDAVPKEIVVKPADKNDHIVGKLGSDITIITYTDLECPFCQRFHATMGQIMDNYREGGKVAWVYRQMPLDMLHSKSRKEAEAAECAGIVGGNVKFWEYTNKIFSYTKSNDSLDLALLPQIATETGLDLKAFNTCLDSGKGKAAVINSESGAADAGAQGTPYSVILTKDGKKVPIDGAMPFENIKATIDGLLR